MLPQVLALKMTREAHQSQQRKKTTQETHLQEASKLVPAQIELRGIFLLSLKGAEVGQKAAKTLFCVGVPAAICCLYTCL